MNKRKRYLPSLLALSIATALGSGTFVFASWATANDVENERPQTTLRGSFSALMQKTLRTAQEPSLRSSFSTLMQQTLRKAKEEEQLLTEQAPAPKIRTVARTVETRSQERRSDARGTSPSFANTNWSKRRNRHSSMIEDNADSPDMELISSISMAEEELTARQKDNSTFKRDAITQSTTPTLIHAPRPTQSKILGASLLAHQGTRISVPTSVTSPRNIGVAPQIRAQVRQQPLPKKWLPDLEVTPSERLAKVRPQAPTPAPTIHYTMAAQTMAQTMPRQSATLEQWPPKDTRHPNSYQHPQQSAATSVVPNQRQRPGSQPQKNVPRAARRWALEDRATIANTAPTNTTPPPMADLIPSPAPNPVPVLEQGSWPEPQYTANNRMAPELPSFGEQPTWQRASSLKTRIHHKRQSLSAYRRPPPVMPKDIYQLASAQEPPVVDHHSDKLSQREPEPRNSGITQHDLQRSNSVDRFRQYVREPLTSVEQPSNNQQPSNQSSSTQQPRHASQKTGAEPTSLKQMLNASTNSLSIQWAVSTDPAVIHKLQQRYPVLNKATVVRFKSIGEVWYLLLTGIYPDRSSAKTALDSSAYQTVAKQLKPWMRPLDGLKNLKLIASNGEPVKLSMQEQQPDRQKMLPQGEYTIQWMESGNHQQLLDVRNRYAQLANAEIIMVSRNHGMRYFLIQGRFAGFQAVENALLAPRFSSLVHQLNPKPRPFASLHHNTQTIPAATSRVSPPEEREDASGKNRPWS